MIRARTMAGEKWSVVQAKVAAVVRTWLRTPLSMKGKAEAYFTYFFPLILYRLSVFPLCKKLKKAINRLLSSIFWVGRKHHVDRAVSSQHPCHVGCEWQTWRVTDTPRDGFPTPSVDREFDLEGESEAGIPSLLLLLGLSAIVCRGINRIPSSSVDQS